jgi:Na+/melibiose symporter-like transporter
VTRLLWATLSALTLLLVVAASLVGDDAGWAAQPVAVLVVFVLVAAAVNCLVEVRRRNLRRAAQRHPSQWARW